ncbi:MAG TPA: amino acid permease [Streptosporangiaceae bacterium]|nr:amino acid permease [Streptosporangiaceae bacterium]
MRRAVGSLVGRDDLAEGLGYTLKRRLLGKPLINEQLSEQRLSKRLALGVLSPDGISSSAYGTEEILIELLKGGLAATAFTLILPITGVVLFVMILVVLSYREVVTVYTRAGGSYVVARDNFGPRVAQIAAVALMVDYVVTVAVQIAAGTAAVASALPVSIARHFSPDVLTLISIGVILLMLIANLRGIREAGRAFAVPTYVFSAVIIIMIITGLVREAFGNLPLYHPGPGIVTGTANHSTLIAFGMVFVLLRAFANGGSSLTGIEAVSNAVSAFQPPEGLNARKVLVAEGLILGTLVAGISWLAHVTHATPYNSGVPTVISQEAGIVFGRGTVFGSVLYIVVQAATALILYTGGNTSFNGFPFLANFVAEDSFLPRWLTKRGHRLAFSNGIIVLAVLSIALLAAVGSNVNRLVPFYAIGVFTAFTLAGLGMAKYHHTYKEPGWRRKLVINFSAGVISLVVVLIFAVVKFTSGAWLVIVIFVFGVPALIRLNRQYRNEATVLESIGSRGKPPEPPTYSRRTVFVFIDDFDLATIAGLRYARSLRPTSLRAVHFVIDNVQADKLRQDWVRASPGITLDFVDCPDRRLAIAAANLVSAEAVLPGVGVTAVLPRRSYAPVVGRLLHDRTADKMASLISRIPHAAATIVPFDVRSRVESLARRGAVAQGAGPAEAAQPAGQAGAGPVPAGPVSAPVDQVPAGQPLPDAVSTPADTPYERPPPRRGVTPIGSLTRPGRATVEGRVHTVEIRPVEHNTVLACDVEDATGQLTAMFYGRSNIAGLRPGVKVRLRGQVGIRSGGPVMINPAYELLAPGEATSAEQQEEQDQQDSQPKRGRNRRDDQQG